MADSGFLPWPPAWLRVWFMIPEAQEGQAWVRAAMGPEARTGPGPSKLWSFRSGLEAASVACVPSVPPSLEPGDPAEGPPERASRGCGGPADPQVPDVPHHAGGLQPAPRGLPRPHLPPHPRARLLCPPRGGEGPGRQGRFPSGLGLGYGQALLRDWELVPQGFRFGSGGLFTSFPSLAFACTCVCTCVFIICCRCI